MAAELYEDDVPAPVTRASDLLGPDFRTLAELDRGTVAYNLSYLAGVWAAIAGAFALFRWKRNPFTFLVAFFVISARQQALLNVQHECIHKMFVPGGREANDRLATVLCASPCMSPYAASKARHLAHHRALGTDADPDGFLHRGADKETRAGLVRYLASALFGGYALRVLGKRGSGEDPGYSVPPEAERSDLRNLALGQTAMLVGTTAVAGPLAYPLLWAAPLGTLTAFNHVVRSYGEHAVLPDELPEHANRLITTTSNRLERFLVAPYWMNLHSEHHLAPWVPARRLRELRRRLQDNPAAPPRMERTSYWATLRAHLQKLP